MKTTSENLQSMSATTAVLAPRALALPIDFCAPVRRIVTLHSGSLRELIFTLPALRALRETFEGAHLCAVVREGLAPLLKDCPLVDEVLAQPEGGLSSQASLMAKLHAQHGDLALAFSPSRKSTLLAWSSGATTRIGFVGAKMDALLTHRVEKDDAPPGIEEFLDLARAAGCTSRCYDYCDLLRPDPHATRAADQLLQERKISDPFLILAPQSETKRTRESEESTRVWAQVAAELSARWPLVLIGARANRVLLRAARESRTKGTLHAAGGELDIAVLAALCGRAKLFVGEASGASHLAAAMSTPVVALYSDAPWRDLAEPRGVPHRLLESSATPETITRSVRELIGC